MDKKQSFTIAVQYKIKNGSLMIFSKMKFEA